jgi:hypothetical protein
MIFSGQNTTTKFIESTSSISAIMLNLIRPAKIIARYGNLFYRSWDIFSEVPDRELMNENE